MNNKNIEKRILNKKIEDTILQEGEDKSDDKLTYSNKIKNKRSIKPINEFLKNKKNKKGIIREYLEAISILVIISILIRIFLIEAYTIPSGSMIPTFKDNNPSMFNKDITWGDRLIASKITYGLRIPILNINFPGITKPERGDIIIFQRPQYIEPPKVWEFLNISTLGIFRIDNNTSNVRILVKRCIAEAGDTLIIDSTEDIYINGEKLRKEHIKTTSYYNGYNRVKVNRYRETNKNKSYIIQEHLGTGRSSPTPTLYLPKKGDKLIIDKIDTNYIYKINEIEINKKLLSHYNYDDLIAGEIGINSIKDLNKKHYELTIKHNYYFGMGDNRDDSKDSRYWGLIRDDLIFGSPLFIFFPFNRIGTLN